MSRTPAARLALLLLLAAAAPASAQGTDASVDEDATALNDPWEGLNRSVFAFNESIDRWILEPVATGYDFVVPDPVERALSRFFENASFPVVFVNDLLQWKPLAAAQDLGRFALNTTAGIGGFFDPASEVGWLPDHDEDFGQTLGVWGVPPGPYLVLPLLGPSSPRDTGGLVVDSATLVYPFFLPFYVNAAATTVRIVNQRSRLLETIAEERKAAFDFYAAVRNAYVQSRANEVADREVKSEESDHDLYDLDYGDEIE